MNENFTQTEWLIQYLDGELEGEQLEAIKKNISDDPAVAAELARLELAQDAVKTYGLKIKIGSLHSEMMQEMKAPNALKIGKMRKMYQYGLRIAAILLVVFAVSGIYQYFTASPERLFNENFQPFTLRETRAIQASPLQEAYRKGDMKIAIQTFNGTPDPAAEDYFLAGNAFLAGQQPVKAIQAFMAMQEKNKKEHTHYFEEDADYYLAMAFLENREPSKALPLFEKIHTDDNHPYHKKVTNSLLRTLHRLAH